MRIINYRKETNKMENTRENLTESARALTQNVNQRVGDISQSIRDSIKEYGDPQMVATSSSDFLQSNTIVAKVAITLLVLISFVILLMLMLYIYGLYRSLCQLVLMNI